MKAVCKTGQGTVGIVDVPEPKITRTDDVKIKVEFVSICKDDALLVNGQVSTPRKPPIVLGHEFSGRIAELGANAMYKGLEIGDAVTGNVFSYCGKCRFCNLGLEHACLNKSITSMVMMEYLVWNEKQVYKLDNRVTTRFGCLTEPIAAGLWAIEKSDMKPGKTAAIYGCGGAGSLLLQLVKLYLAQKITVIEPVPAKRQYALENGADFVIDPVSENVYERSNTITNGIGFDIIFEAAGSEDTLETAMQIIADSGTLVLYSLHKYTHQININPFSVYTKELTIKGVYYAAPKMFLLAVDLMNQMRLDSIISAEVPITQAQAAFEAYNTGENRKIVMRF
jgi:(R,R)-butanediol dehydrogenase/meso-butanediol dehydrogenase/diacetyl reductase/L-iditol 2-dehydrogenase